MPAQYTFIDTAYVEFVSSIFSQTVENTIYVKNASFWTDVTLTNLATALGQWWETEIAPLVSSSLVNTLIRARNMGEVDSYVVEYTTGIGGSITTSPALPSNTALVVKFGSGLAGRAKRGRNYVMGLCEDQVAGNVVNSGVVTSFVTAYEAMSGYLTGESPFWQHCIASRAGLPAEGGQGDTYVVTNYSSSGLVRTQRRRLTGVGS